MNSSEYRSAMEKISPDDRWREKTLEAMRAAKAQEPEKKTLRFPKKTIHRAALSAAAVLMLAVAPVMMYRNANGEKAMEPVQFAQPGQARMVEESPEEAQGAPLEEAAPETAEDAGQPETDGAALFSARSMMPDLSCNPTQTLANDAMPGELAVFAVTESEEEMKQALTGAAKALGQTMTDFAYDAQEKSAGASAGDYRLSMHEQRVRITSAQGALAKAPEDMTPEEKVSYYRDTFAANFCVFESPAMQIEPSEKDFRVTVFEAKDADAAQRLEQYSFSRVELTLDAQDDALTSLAYTVRPQALETLEVIGVEQAKQAGNAADACARELLYRRTGDTLRPYYHFIFSDAGEVFVPALAADDAEGKK